VCYVKFTEDPTLMADEDEVIYISRDETILRHLAIGVRIHHPLLANAATGMCHSGSRAAMQQRSVEISGGQRATGKMKNESDPRWEALKKFKKD
jgi:hypothetical protein